MSINLSKKEIRVILTALRDWMDPGDRVHRLDNREWLHRQDAAADLIFKLEAEQDRPEQPAKQRKSRPVALCGNDPVEW